MLFQIFFPSECFETKIRWYRITFDPFLIAGMFGVALPINESKLKMLLEENVVQPPAENALLSIFEIDPIPLDAGLRILADHPVVEQAQPPADVAGADLFLGGGGDGEGRHGREWRAGSDESGHLEGRTVSNRLTWQLGGGPECPGTQP